MRRGALRIGIVALLVGGAVFAALPWISCVYGLGRIELALLSPCTFGGFPFPPQRGLPGFSGPFYGNLVVGLAYLAAAIYVARTKREL